MGLGIEPGREEWAGSRVMGLGMGEQGWGQGNGVGNGVMVWEQAGDGAWDRGMDWEQGNGAGSRGMGVTMGLGTVLGVG